tara:strand:+ start:710 stop:1648 length:939 start_codon:yes stop_codon:yes gene_type:complete
MKVISTFAGCGGSSTGYKMAGCEVVAMVEWDRHAVDCYALNHPTTKLFHGDINKIQGADLLKATGLERGELDVLDGSPPCQGFSTSGRRVLDDPRNELFRQQIRLIQELQPKHVVIENVAGMIKGKMKRVAGEIFRAIEAEGYQVCAGLIKATAFGVAQYRPRVFFIGSRGSKPVLPAPTHQEAVTAGEALKGVRPVGKTTATNKTYHFMVDNLRAGETGKQARKRLGLSGSFHAHLMLDPRKPSLTLLKQSSHHVYHWSRRYIAQNEALVLTGFPVDYQLTGSRSKWWARIGNSVAPPVSAAIARSMMEGK